MSSPLAQPGPPARRSPPAGKSPRVRSSPPVGAPRSRADRLTLQHQRNVALVAGGVTSIVASAALGADPMAVGTWFWGAVDGLVSRIQVGYAANRNSTLEYVRRHAAMNATRVTALPGSLDVADLRRQLFQAGPTAFDAALAAGRDTDEALHGMARQMSNVADEHVRDGDRDVTVRSERGKGIRGWRRRLSGRACGFCAMLASRGAVYKDRRTATIAKDGDPYHDSCHCYAEAAYKGQPEPAEVRLLQRQWSRITAGKSETQAINAWRRHWERKATPAARARFSIPSPGTGPAMPAPAVRVRPSLVAARDPQAVAAVFRAEYAITTGRSIDVTFSGSVQTAREHAEGLLRAAERFPDVPLERVALGSWTDSGYAKTLGREIRFSDSWSSLARRQDYLDAASRDAAARWHPSGTPDGVALHEFGHVLSEDFLGGRIHQQVEALVRRRAVARGVPFSDAASEVSGYGAGSVEEFIAEAFADVMSNGARASALSRQVFDLLEAEYRLGASAARGPATVLRSAPDIARMPTTALRKRVTDAGITVPTGLRTPALRQLVDDLDAGMPPAAARARAVQAIVDERRAVAEVLADVDQALVEQASARALAHIARRVDALAPEIKPQALAAALRAGDVDAARAASAKLATTAKLKPAGVTGAVTRFDRATMDFAGTTRGDVVQVVRPGFTTTLERKTLTLSRATVQPATPAQVAALPAKAAKATKAAAPKAPRARVVQGGDLVSEMGVERYAAWLTRRRDELGAAGRSDSFVGGRAHTIEAVAERQGFAGRPSVVSPAEMDRLIDGGASPMYRGLSRDFDAVDPATARSGLDFADEFRTGEAHYAAGTNGSGIYFIETRAAAGAYADHPDAILRAVLRPDAKVIERQEVRRMIADAKSRAAADGVEWPEALSDEGVFAASLGYDAMTARARSGLTTIILNRTAVIVDSGKAARAAAKTATKAVKKAPAPKLPPAPEKLSIPALKTELSKAIDLDLSGVPKPVLARWVRTVRDPGSSTLTEHAARFRQEIVDKRRALAEALSEVDELLANGASTAALTARGAARLKRLETALADWPELAEVRKLAAAMATGDARKIRTAMASARRKGALEQIGPDAGKTARYDPKTMTAIDGAKIPDGAPVVVVRPGYTVQIGSERVVLSRPVVEVVPEAPRIDRTVSPSEVLAQERAARTSALAAPPVKYQGLPRSSAGGKALGYYQHRGDIHMNGLLRRGKVGRPHGMGRGVELPSAEQVQASIDQIDALMAQSVLDEGIVVYRGMSDVGRVFRGGSEPGSLVGRTFTDKGFTSTSADRRVAMQFMAGEGFDDAGILVEVRVPPGTRAIQVSNDDFAGRAKNVESEREILLDRGLRYRVVSDEIVDDVFSLRGEAAIGSRPYRHVVVEVIP